MGCLTTTSCKSKVILISLSIPLFITVVLYSNELMGAPTPQETTVHAGVIRGALIPGAASVHATQTNDNKSTISSHNISLEHRTNALNSDDEANVYIFSKQSMMQDSYSDTKLKAENNRSLVSIVVNNGAVSVEEGGKTEETRAEGATVLRDLGGYVSILNPQDHLDMHCSKCAYVSSSGQLVGKKAGQLIDSFPCVIRMNNAPVKGYEQDVGKKTTVRVVAHSAISAIVKEKKDLLAGSAQPNYVLVWGPAAKMVRTGKGSTYNVAAGLARDVGKSGVQMYMLTQKQIQTADDTFEMETGKNRVSSGSWLSTGWFTMMFARAVCDEINVFGMISDDHCRKNSHSRVAYHYYQELGQSECQYYVSNEKASRNAHRFVTEKTIFARWSKMEPKIFFHHPVWFAAA